MDYYHFKYQLVTNQIRHTLIEFLFEHNRVDKFCKRFCSDFYKVTFLIIKIFMLRPPLYFFLELFFLILGFQDSVNTSRLRYEGGPSFLSNNVRKQK